MKIITENTHYDPSRKTRVRTDASRSGLGAVLEQESSNGWETIAYASWSLNKAEENYRINQLELLGIVWLFNILSTFYMVNTSPHKQATEHFYPYLKMNQRKRTKVD